PAMEAFIWRERHPTESRLSEPDSHVKTAKSEERNQRRAPVMARVKATRVPAPAAVSVEPASVMVRGPAPGVVADPAPAIPVDPGPAPGPVRGPVGAHAWRPNPTVGRRVHPAAV